MLDDGETECEIERILAHCNTQTGRRSYYGQWRGLSPEENEWMTTSRLKDAAVVQDLDELKSTGSCCKSG